MTSHRKPKTINPDEVDPSVYYYDEVYDEMQHAQGDQADTDKKSEKQQGSKYIRGIIETAERRKSEKEIRKFKKYARDREEARAEGVLDQTDVYVSKSYERKLKEMQETIKKHSALDEDHSLNSFKRVKSHNGDEKVTPDEYDKSNFTPTTKKSSDDPNEKPGTSDEHHQLERNQGEKQPSETKTKVRKLETIEDRKEYLREVLAKRTVGEVFKAAQERYRQRKSKS